MKARRAQDLLEPLDALEEEHVLAEGFLHRVVDYRHQRNDGVERDQQDHRHDQPPGFLIDGLVVHRDSPAIQPLTYNCVYAGSNLRNARSDGSAVPSATSSLMIVAVVGG